MKSIKEIVQRVRDCQRNFDLDHRIPQEHQDYIIECATSMPTRYARPHYNITVITDPEHTRFMYNEVAVDLSDEIDTEGIELPNGQTNEIGNLKPNLDFEGKVCCYKRNGQTNAPLLLVFGVTEEFQVGGSQPPHRRKDVMQSLMLGSAGAAMAAVELGYYTGFCRCFKEDVLSKFLIEHTDCTKPDPRLLLGIGMPHPGGFSRGVSVLDGKAVYKADEMGKASIPVHRYK